MRIVIHILRYTIAKIRYDRTFLIQIELVKDLFISKCIFLYSVSLISHTNILFQSRFSVLCYLEMQNMF